MGSALAAVVGEKSDEFLQGVHPRPVNHEPPLGPELDQPSPAQFLEVKRQRRCRHPQPLRNLSGRQAIGSKLDQQAEEFEARFLGQSAESHKCILFFHISRHIEL